MRLIREKKRGSDAEYNAGVTRSEGRNKNSEDCLHKKSASNGKKIPWSEQARVPGLT